MNWGQFKDHVSHICLAGAVVASWSLTQQVAGLNPFNDTFLSLPFNSCIVWNPEFQKYQMCFCIGNPGSEDG